VVAEVGSRQLYPYHMPVLTAGGPAVLPKQRPSCSVVSRHLEVTAVFSLTIALSEMEASSLITRYYSLIALRVCHRCVWQHAVIRISFLKTAVFASCGIFSSISYNFLL
jgi:hypothetical protein